jgi:NAD(P)H dehydrogenase (quinone)
MPISEEKPRHLIVLGHPRDGSFNHQVAETYARVVKTHGQEAEVRDLYALGFDPLLRLDGGLDAKLEHEIELVRACDMLVFVYPIWFGTPPAIIKGYVERVLGAGFQPAELKSGERGPLAGKRFLTLSTSATSLPWLNERGQWHSLRQAFDRYLAELFRFRAAEHIHLDLVAEGASETYLLELLDRVAMAARCMCSEIAAERHAGAAAAALTRQAARHDTAEPARAEVV